MERQALRRVDAGTLEPERVERLGRAFERLEQQMSELKEQFELDDDDLTLRLGPLPGLEAEERIAGHGKQTHASRQEVGTVASLKDTVNLTSQLTELTNQLHSELTEGEVDFEKMVQIADEISEHADNLAAAFTRVNEALSEPLSDNGSNGGSNGSERRQQPFTQPAQCQQQR